jgi:nitronate monooxygenase
MSLDPGIRASMTLPAVCAPMFLVSGPDLVREACKTGIMAGLPRGNARSFEVFEGWLTDIRSDLDRHLDEHPDATIGPLAVNLSTRMAAEELTRNLELSRRCGVDIIISATGDPTELTKRVHDEGLKIFHDVTSLRFAEKAIGAGVDGMTCIGSGGGGKSGTLGHLVLIPKVRSMFEGTIICAGSVTNGAAIRAAEILGADLAYLGTRFIATQESMADPAYKQMLVDGTSSDLLYTPDIVGVSGNWLVESIRRAGLDPIDLPRATATDSTHLPPTVQPWKNVWSAGQGLDLIHDVPTVADLVERLRAEYADACRISEWISPSGAT